MTSLGVFLRKKGGVSFQPVFEYCSHW